MTTWTSNQIKLKGGVTADVKADADGVTLGVQSNGTLLVDLNTDDIAVLDSLIVALVSAKHHCLAAREG